MLLHSLSTFAQQQQQKIHRMPQHAIYYLLRLYRTKIRLTTVTELVFS